MLQSLNTLLYAIVDRPSPLSNPVMHYDDMFTSVRGRYAFNVNSSDVESQLISADCKWWPMLVDT